MDKLVGNGHQSTPSDLSPQISPSLGLSYRTPSRLPLRSPSGKGPASSGGSGSRSVPNTPPAVFRMSSPYLVEDDHGWGYFYYKNITMADGSVITRPATPGTAGCLHGQFNARIESWQQALESPNLPRPTAIPSQQIACYPHAWRDGLHDGIYSDIPTYMRWCRGELPIAVAQLAPMEGQPFTSALPREPLAGPIEPVFEGPHQSDRVWQQQQRPDNVYGNDLFVDHLTDSQWEEIVAGRIPQPSSNLSAMEKGNLLCSYVSHQPTTNWGTLELELALELLHEEGEDSLQNFLLTAARRTPPTLKCKTLKGGRQNFHIHPI